MFGADFPSQYVTMQFGQLPSGPETGNFYSPSCNALKEWLSCDCKVDYIQPYHPTSGWIRVKGPHNFYDRLEDGVFNGRRIIYDGSNLTSAIVVKEVHDDESTTPVNGTVRSHQQAPASFSAQTDHQPAPYSYASSEPSSLVVQARASVTTWCRPTVSDLQQVPTDLGYFSEGCNSTQTQGTWCPECPAYVSNRGFLSSDAAPSNRSSQAVSVEHRRITIRRIEHSTPEDQIKASIKRSLVRVTPVKTELQRVEVPGGSGSDNRRHAFATSRTGGIARSVADLLNGNRLEARLTAEGVAEEQASRACPTPSSGSSSWQKKCDKSKQKTSERARAPVSSRPASLFPEPSSSCSSRQGASGSSSFCQRSHRRARRGASAQQGR
ncbi:hypothetical protein K456DRAFT_1766865 [Colletotrichum gloeosporioides 23]|nr:hypothetical protein K456DRAFT_1766865 [Colletotrichum gloeosporioides 23]